MSANNVVNLASKIRLVILDVDGVLTNGELFFFDTGEFKAFNARDGLGISLLVGAGIELAIISGNKSDAVEQRFKKFGIKHIYQGVSDKREAYKKIKNDLDISDQSVAYMGDDLIDLPVMTQVGLPTAVANADVFVKQYAQWVSRYNGGCGAVRELCELILAAQGKLDQIQQQYLS
ncbi:MAG: HAD hydrolase family protein [Gammaproteobacteria bacterium]|nr:HAD hydrolase family protein [Gammaproteobacteria bacterium]